MNNFLFFRFRDVLLVKEAKKGEHMFLALIQKREFRFAVMTLALSLILAPEQAFAQDFLRVLTTPSTVSLVRSICSPLWVIFAVIEIFSVVSGSTSGISLKDLFAKILFLLALLIMIVGYKSVVEWIVAVVNGVNI